MGSILRKALPPILLVIPLAIFTGHTAWATPDSEHNDSHSLELTIDAPDLAHSGDTVSYTFRVTNTGHATLHDIVVEDSELGSIGSIDVLKGGDSAEPMTKTLTVPADQQNDIADDASACAKADDKSDHNDTCGDAHHVLKVIHPRIRVQLASSPSDLFAGDSVTFGYKVTNLGDVTLNDVSVEDGNLGSIGHIASLEAGESKSFSQDVTVDLSTDTSRWARAEGTDPLELQVSDRDDLDITLSARPTTTTVTKSVSEPTTTTTVAPTTTTTVPTDVLGETLSKPAPAPAPAQLPHTGANTMTLLAIGLGLSLSGLVLRAKARRISA
jgi:LPXTG-motif cell wall-anchored protein